MLRDVEVTARTRLGEGSPAAVAFVVEELDCIDPLWAAKGDQTLLTRAFTNMLFNAIKSTPPPGSITMHVEFEELSASEGRLVVRVTDTGRGLDADALPFAAVPFAQIRMGGDMQEGTGLHLALAKQMIEVGHDGSLTLASAGVGMGVTATATVQMEWTADAPSELLAAASAVAPLLSME